MNAEPDSEDVLWLWKNGDHMLAYRHLYPCYPGGDPMVLGEPVAKAYLRQSFDRGGTSPQAAQTEADELLRKWNLDPDLYRTDSGALNHMKIAAALKHPDDYPHTAQTAVKSESLAQAAQALAQPPSEGKPIEALAPTEAALSEVVRLSEDAGLYGADFQTEAQEREAFEAWPRACKEIIDRCVAPDMYPQARALLDLAVLASRAGRKG